MNWENFKRDLPLLIKHASGAFCSAPIAGRASLSLMSSAISQTKLNSWESILLRRNPVRFLVTSDLSGCCNARPGLLTLYAGRAPACVALVANCFLGALHPACLRAVCFVQEMYFTENTNRRRDIFHCGCFIIKRYGHA